MRKAKAASFHCLSLKRAPCSIAISSKTIRNSTEAIISVPVARAAITITKTKKTINLTTYRTLRVFSTLECHSNHVVAIMATSRTIRIRHRLSSNKTCSKIKKQYSAYQMCPLKLQLFIIGRFNVQMIAS